MKKKKRERGGTEGGMIKERDREMREMRGGSVRVSQKISIVSTLSSGTWTVRYPTTACLERSCRPLEWNGAKAPECRTVWHSQCCAVLLSTEPCGAGSAVLFFGA